MLKIQYPTDLTHPPARFRDEVVHKRLLVFCNISARLSRYLVDKRAANARYSRKLTCSDPVTLIHS